MGEFKQRKELTEAQEYLRTTEFYAWKKCERACTAIVNARGDHDQYSVNYHGAKGVGCREFSLQGSKGRGVHFRELT